MDRERPKGKTVTVAGAAGRTDGHIHACDIDLTDAVAAPSS
jgi:hypothetical protein